MAADRRPSYLPTIRFCCRACREGHQLHCAAAYGSDEIERGAAAQIEAHLVAIKCGRYGGVRDEQLFD